jgi:hypothetical protein
LLALRACIEGADAQLQQAGEQGGCVFQAAVFVTRRLSEADSETSSLTLRVAIDDGSPM